MQYLTIDYGLVTFPNIEYRLITVFGYMHMYGRRLQSGSRAAPQVKRGEAK